MRKINFVRINKSEVMIQCGNLVPVILFEFVEKPIEITNNYIIYRYYDGIEKDILKSLK